MERAVVVCTGGISCIASGEMLGGLIRKPNRHGLICQVEQSAIKATFWQYLPVVLFGWQVCPVPVAS